MPLRKLQEQIQNRSGRKLQLKINDNRSTMLSVKWGEPDDSIKVSLHRMFLNAPRNVMEALSCYIGEEHPSMPVTVKNFIDSNVKTLDYTHLLNQSKLCSQGNVYNLKDIYYDLNQQYFNGNLNLSITWFGKPMQRNRTRITFGLYHDPLKLIKVNRFLDNPTIPDYFVGFVIYHEMVHHVCPSYVDEKGHHKIHSKEFKQQEMKYRYYDLAQSWIDENKYTLFPN